MDNGGGTTGRSWMDNFSKHIVRFNAFQIKIIALITMTLDHIGAYQTFTFSREINDGLRVVGRIAAPLFLFMVVEGLRYTRSKPKYILRLYIAGIVIEMINSLSYQKQQVRLSSEILCLHFFIRHYLFSA